MLRSRTETRLIIIIINWLTKLRTKSTFCWMKEKIVIFSSKWLVGMGKINNSFVIHHLSAWLFPRASARLAKSLVSFLRVAVYLVFISNMLTDGKAHQIQHNKDKEYSLDKGHHDGTWKRARSICGHANDWITPCDPPIAQGQAIFERRQYFLGDAWAHVKNYQERALLINRGLDRVTKPILANI